ncbi:MAG: type II toxin-antitoxin system RelB family antitoxin [Lentihominibacter sp.]
MATISLRVPDNELNAIKNYAKINNKTVSEIIRETMISRIEDEYDMKVFDEYLIEKENGNVKTYSHDDVWKALGI